MIAVMMMTMMVKKEFVSGLLKAIMSVDEQAWRWSTCVCVCVHCACVCVYGGDCGLLHTWRDEAQGTAD